MYTLGSSADLEHVLRDPGVGRRRARRTPTAAATSRTTGPGSSSATRSSRSPSGAAGQRDVVAYVRRLEVGARSRCSPTSASTATRSPGYTGVWVGDEKIAAIGVRVARGPHPARLRAQRRSRPHDVRPHRPVRHPRPRRHVDGAAARRPRPTMRAVVDRVVARFAEAFGLASVDRQDVAWRGRADDLAPFTTAARRSCRRCGCSAGSPRPAWRRGRSRAARAARVDEGARPLRRRYLELKKLDARPRPPHGVRGSRLPEHLRVLGRPHRHVHDPRRSLHARVRLLPGRHAQAARVDADEPRRVAEAVAHARPRARVITCVARDDLPDGGASVFAATVDAIRADEPATPRRAADLRLQGRRRVARDDLRGAARRAEPQPRDRRAACSARRARRPGTRARSSVLARAKDAGLVDEVGAHPRHGRDRRRGARRARRPARGRRRHRHDRPVPAAVARSTCRSCGGGRPRSSTRSASYAEALGFAHVEAGPLVRSSYHARAGNRSRWSASAS